ncbi:hypothetical protein GQ53DRAFT_888809 [Thozetella sp. PMI_491]|nr:hypothetical protein GQ53DRAFT_888809 [Thozetella sp. PMI_491]
MKAVLVAALAAVAAAAPTEPSTSSAGNETLQARTDAPFGIKKGLAYNNGGITGVLSRPNSATWAYNWGTALNAPKFQQIPMYHCPGSGGDAAGVMRKIDQGDTPWVLGYNEPDETVGNGGCNASPEAAYDAWGNDMFKFQQRGVKLVCPAVSSWETNVGHTGGPAGLVWLRQFARNFNKNPSASGPGQFRCSAQALHWFGDSSKNAAQQAQLFKDYIVHAHSVVNDIFQTNMELWITEFAPLPFGNTQLLSDFLAIVIPWLNAQDYVGRYSPFMAEDLVTNGNLNQAGVTFVNS